MKLLVLCVLTVAVNVVVAAPQNVDLLEYSSENDGLGTYSFFYELSDGSSRSEKGELRNAGSKDEFITVSGSYSWIGPDGARYTGKYVADENGYRVSTKKATLGVAAAGYPATVVASLLG